MEKAYPPVVIATRQLDHVLSHDKVLYNTNNHYNDEGVEQPADYAERNNRGNTKHWVELFHAGEYHKFELDKADLRWMKKALYIGMQTGRFSHMYDDELEMTCKKHEGVIPPGKWFVRTERVSLKEGVHGAGPYSDLKSIIESMVTGRPGHFAFQEEDETCTVYLFPWLEHLNPDKEFRIFVHENQITAISAQHLYTVNQWLTALDDDEIMSVVHKILDHFEEHIREKLSFLGSYTMDLMLIGDEDTPYFIEPNSFGKYYAAGSALYNWVYDHDTLHGHDSIEIRYVNEY